jgi:DNA-binding transcriptional LysR family regulator
MDLHATPYRYFLAIAETQSFGRAAERLNMSQPALSAGLKEFERRLGFALFSRTSRRVELTAQGKLFLGNARRMVAEAEWANRAANAIRDNRLLIGASLYTALIRERNDLTDRFMMEHPKVTMRISTLSDQAIMTDLQQERLELGIVLEHEETVSRGSSIEAPRSDRFERVVFASRQVMLLFPDEHPLARAPDVSLAALAGQEVVMINRSHGVSLAEEIADRFLANDIAPITPPEGHALAVERYAKIFRKPAICLGWFADQLPRAGGRMIPRRAEGLDIVTELALLRHGDGQRPGALSFWNMAQAAAKAASHG